MLLACPALLLEAPQIPALYAGLFSQLMPGGCAVTITRPQEVDYPLFRRAHEVGRCARCAQRTGSEARPSYLLCSLCTCCSCPG